MAFGLSKCSYQFETCKSNSRRCCQYIIYMLCQVCKEVTLECVAMATKVADFDSVSEML